ncbi:CBL-interacting protein kinase 31 [Symbiodinium microadriaticum]|uniref:non-specific serine/threonine protein kinase n=1 Tax=Symbiodinium microadriaticum TaxID=2951 RepID=A0A1Q9D3G2_SYMMI|nr:CBL-interacting protein kinase 31 [Symbiodinium microadriaticum]
MDLLLRLWPAPEKSCIPKLGGTRRAHEYPKWSGTLDCQECMTEYKFVIFDARDDRAVWEDGANRFFGFNSNGEIYTSTGPAELHTPRFGVVDGTGPRIASGRSRKTSFSDDDAAEYAVPVPVTPKVKAGNASGGFDDELHFDVVCGITGVGDAVVAVGSCDELGSWDVFKGVKLCTSGEVFPRWMGMVHMKSCDVSTIQFKLAIIKGNSAEWESSDNRQLRLPAGVGEGPWQALCEWNNSHCQVQPLRMEAVMSDDLWDAAIFDAPTGWARAATEPPPGPAQPLADLKPKQQKGLQWRRQMANKLVLEHTRSKLEMERQEMALNASLRDLYDVQESVGQGCMGVVHKGKRKSDGKEVALKMLRVDDEEMGQIVKREYDTLTSLNHPYIIKAIDYLSERGQAIIVLEYFHGETLTRAVRTSSAKTGLLTEGRARRIFQMLVSAVEYLHARHIIHRDIKGDNVLVSANFDDLRLIDFNVAGRLLEGDSLTVTGTQEYWPPELFRDVTARSIWESSSVAGKAGDIWSAGLCLHLLITGQLPKRAADFKNAEAFKEAVATKPVTCQDASWKEISIPGRDVLQRCMQMEPQLRPTAEDLLGERWFQEGLGVGG